MSARVSGHLTIANNFAGPATRASGCPPGSDVRKYLLTNARADKIERGWPWKLINRHGRCAVVADGFYEPEKLARAKEKAPWSFYSLPSGALFLMAGLCSDASDPNTGEVLTTFAVVTTNASPDLHIHDRMPALLSEPEALWRWLFDVDLSTGVLAPSPAGTLQRWRVADSAKNSRAPDGPKMVEPVA